MTVFRTRQGRLAGISLLAHIAAFSAVGDAAAQGRPAGDGWEVRLGLLGTYAPDYEGSDEYEVRGFPDLEVTYSDWFFLSGREGLGVNLLRGGPVTAGVALGFDGGRDQDENSALRGLGDVDETMEARAFATWTLDRLIVTASVKMDVLGEGHDGVVAELGAAYMFTPAPDLMVFAGPSLTWADESYMQSYFGIDAAQSARAQRPGFDAGSGFKDVGATMVAIQRLTENWSLTGLVAYKRMLGDAADSPLVADLGSEDQIVTGIGLSYSF